MEALAINSDLVLFGIDTPLKAEDHRRMESPFVLDDGTKLKPAHVDVDARNPCTFHVTIIEGKNRQIRRLCEALGYEVQRLRRLSIGGVRLGTLREGQTRPLTDSERSSIMSLLPS